MNTTRYVPISDYLLAREVRATRRAKLEPNGEQHRDMLCNFLLFMMMVGGAAASSSLLMVSEVPATVSPAVQDAIKHAVSVMDDGRLRIACLLGSLGGGILSTLLFPLGRPKEYAGKILGSSITGLIFSPKLMEWLHWDADLTNVVAMSGIVSLLSWSVLQPLVPLLGNLITKWVGSKFKPQP